MSGGRDAEATSRWARVCAVLDAVHDAPAGERARVLAESCAGDVLLRAEVESLLRAETQVGDRLESPLLHWTGVFPPAGEPAEADVGEAGGDRVGPWRLVAELGQGGMATVWLAERADGSAPGRVALKVLKRGIDGAAFLRRFSAERGILAQLEHPGIVRPIDGGVTADGRPYFTMELVEGEPITRWCDVRRLSIQERLRVFLPVLDAVHYAHENNVIHRDLKPSNILVTSSGEVKLLDFGIARLMSALTERADPATLTLAGFRMLTPEYAAPEQIRGETVTRATDVYALGALLYELLTGSLPGPGRRPSAAATAMAVTPPPPSTRVTPEAARARDTAAETLRAMLRPLDPIVLRALDPDPERRPAGADELRDDLQRYLERRPGSRRPGTA